MPSTESFFAVKAFIGIFKLLICSTTCGGPMLSSMKDRRRMQRQYALGAQRTMIADGLHILDLRRIRAREIDADDAGPERRAPR